MNILFNTDQIYLHGGIEKVMATKANYLAQLLDVKVYIITTEQNNQPPCYHLDEKIQMIDLAINYNRSKSYFSQENLKKVVQHYRKQKALFKKLKPHTIISPNYNFDHYWLPFLKGKAKLIKERHSSRYLEAEQRQKTSFLGKLKYRLNDWIDRKYDHIVVLNETEKKYVNSKNAVVIPNPVEESGYTADLNNKKVIAAGRIAPVKGFDHLIKAWTNVYKNAPEWQLHIYGDDCLDTKKTLQELVVVNGLEKVVHFKGSVENLPQTMTNYSMYAMTSVTECFPMVLLEALSVGLPIVSYDCPNGPRHIITDQQDGFLVPPNNPKAFAQQLIQLMENKNLRQQMSEKAQLNSQRFATQKTMQQWSNLIFSKTNP